MNEEETVDPLTNEDSNDEDNEEYFLQSAAGAYNIQEKIREANDELFDDYEEYKIIREQRVTFKEDLVDYEPDFSSDDGYVQSPDVLSIISDYENDQNTNNYPDDDSLPIKEINYDNFEQRSTTSEHDNFENNSDNELKCLYKQTNKEIYSAISEELENCDKVIIEEINDLNENTEDEIDEENLEDNIIEVVEIINDSFTGENENVSANSRRNEISPAKTKKKKNLKNTQKDSIKQEVKINCRIHCMEKKELDLITEKIKIFKEDIKCPPLKLNKRKCCKNQQYKPKLPVYNGLISEYGLTKSQLEKKQKKKEKNFDRKREKLFQINEEKIQKDLYNEEIFCAWLKSLKYRNQNNVNNNNNKENEINKNIKVKQRPKTASYCNLSLAINKPKIKRPNTSPTKSCSSYKIIFK